MNKVYTQDKLETWVTHLFGGMRKAKNACYGQCKSDQKANKQKSTTATTKTNKKLRQISPPRLDLLNPSFP